jgi:hypothetical protein
MPFRLGGETFRSYPETPGTYPEEGGVKQLRSKREELRIVGWAGLGWAGLGWAGLGWAGLGWAGLGCFAAQRYCFFPYDAKTFAIFYQDVMHNLQFTQVFYRRKDKKNSD